jgi:hypothetical protein
VVVAVLALLDLLEDQETQAMVAQAEQDLLLQLLEHL